MLTVVLLSGKAESGKDTFYELAIDKMNNFCSEVPFQKVAFADAVKKTARDSFGWDGNKDEKGRSLLIMIGDGGRGYDPLIWIKKVIQKLSDYRQLYKDEQDAVVFITDCRYPNEITEIKDWGDVNSVDCYSIRVERPNHQNKLTEAQRNNPSETALDLEFELFDYVVTNGRELEDFAESVDLIMREILDV
jgi:dephospho-CoA kinase